MNDGVLLLVISRVHFGRLPHIKLLPHSTLGTVH